MNRFSGWRVPLLASIFLIAAFGAFASTPVIWKQAGLGDFLRGETRGVSITGKGRLTLSPVLDPVFESDEPLIWSIATDSSGNIYAGTGNDGKLYRMDTSGRSEVFFDAEELEIRSVVIDGDDRIYAATFPAGRIYRINPDGTHTVFFDPTRDAGVEREKGGAEIDGDAERGDNGAVGGTGYIWSLALDAEGGLYAGTGEQGRIYRIDENGAARLVAELEEAHVMALAVDGSGRLIAGTEPGGRVYRMAWTTPDGPLSLSVLHDSPYGEINALQVDAEGAVFACALSGPRRGGRAGGAMSPPSRGAPDEPVREIARNTVEVTASADGADRTSVRSFVGGGSVVLRIDPDGRVEEWWRSQTDVCLSLAARGEKELLIGTGPHGRLYSVRERGRGTLLNELRESQITALMPVATGGVVVATSNRGNLYRLRSRPVREGEYESDVLDTRGIARWGRIRWENKQPAGTTVQLYARSGNTDTPDQTWSGWTGPYTDPEGEALSCPPARYLQWKAVLGTENDQAPSITSVSAAYLTRNNPPRVHSVTVYEPGVHLRDATPGLAGQTDLPPAIAAQVGGPGNGRGQNASAGAPSYRKGMRAIAVQASDPDGDGLSFGIYFRGAAEETWKLLESDRRASSYSWDSETFPDGEYVIRVVVSDAPSNPPEQALESDHFTDPFLVDNTGPLVTRINVSGGRLSFMVQDSASPLFRVEYAINGRDWRVVHPADGVTDSRTESFEIALDELEPGEYTLAIRARDTSNNTGTGKRVVTIP